MIRLTSWVAVVATATQAITYELHLLAEAIRRAHGGG